MYRPSILSFLIGAPYLAAAVALPSTLQPRQSQSTDCVTGLHVVCAPGYNDGGANYGIIGTLVTAITDRVPNSNSWDAGPYDQSGTFPEGTAGVEQQVRQHLADYTASCPDTKIALVGVSAGGVTVMNTLCGANGGLSPPWPTTEGVVSSYPNIVASIAYGDETFAANQPFNAADCVNNAPNGYRTDFSQCSSFFDNMKSYCYSTDPVCCTGGNDSASHTAYDGQYDDEAADFVAAKFNAAT